jgi:hypothetical protein
VPKIGISKAEWDEQVAEELAAELAEQHNEPPTEKSEKKVVCDPREMEPWTYRNSALTWSMLNQLDRRKSEAR